jgi:hypothetical protein
MSPRPRNDQYLVSERMMHRVVSSEPGGRDWRVIMKKLLFAAGFLAMATSAASAQVYVYPSVPYGYGAGYYNYGSPYAPEPYAAAPGFYGFYGFDPTANNWEYYRSSAPGRGWDAESTR